MPHLIDMQALGKYTLIITPLLALRDHLNASVTKPMLGHWAYTPKRLSSLNAQTVGPAEMLLELSKTLGIEAADACLAAILPAWEELGSLDKVKDELKQHPQFDVIEKAIGIIGKLPSVWQNREHYPGAPKYLDCSKVGVIGADYLTGLDREFLKNFKYEEIPLTLRKTKPVIIRMAGKANAISAALSLIQKHGPEQCALITAGGTDIRAVLEQTGIPVMGRPYTMSNYPPVHWFSTLLHLRLQDRGTWQNACLDLLVCAKKLTHAEANRLRGYHIARRPLPKPAQEYLAKLEACTLFSDLLPLAAELTDLDPSPLLCLLDDTGLLRKGITVPDSYLFLKVLNLLGGRQGEKARSGLLLADAANAVGITRPVQILLGVDESWLEHPITKEQVWRDRDVEAKKREQMLRALFHQAQHTVCILVDYAENEAVVANKVLGEVLKAKKPEDGPLKNIHIKRDCQYRGHVEWQASAPKLKTSGKGISKRWSKSSLDTMCTCPRRLLYDKIVDFEEIAPHMTLGSAMHAYAEQQIWLNKGNSGEAARAGQKLNALTEEYLAQLPPEQISDAKAQMARLKKAVDTLVSQLTAKAIPEAEAKETVAGLLVTGRFDVLCEDGGLWDFKTAQAEKRGDKLKSLPLGRFDPAKPDSQTMAYLYLRRLRKAKNLSITYQYLKEMIKPNPDPAEVSLAFTPESPVPSKGLLAEICVAKGGKGKFTAKEVASAGDEFLALGEKDAEALCRDIIAAMSGLDREELVARLTSLLLKHFKDEEFVGKCVQSAIQYFSTRLLDQDLDAFEKYLLAQQERLERSNKEGFARAPADKKVCDGCAYVTLCGERGYKALADENGEEEAQE